jgi:hypothetical protein
MSVNNMLLVQQYLLNNSLLDLQKTKGVYAKLSNSGQKFSLSYDQIEAKESDPLAQECRGLILAAKDGRQFSNSKEEFLNTIPGPTQIIAFPFKRFFNFGQGAAFPIDFSKEIFIQEKLDGCLHEDVNILTPDGLFTIKAICEEKKINKVYSMNMDSLEIEEDDIIGFSVKNNNNDWYEIELEDNSKVILTGNHKIFIPELSCYRAVKDLIGNENVLVEK